MQNTFKKVISFGLLLSICAVSADLSKKVTPKFTIRSQGTNAARRAVNSTNHVMLYNMEKWYGTLSVTPEYTRAFNRGDIAECLFGDALCDKKTLKIQGSRVQNRDENALLADYFYLPTDYDSQLTVNPLIQNFLVDFNLFVGLDEWVQGLYMFVQFPVTYTKWGLNCCEDVIASGTLAHVEGYFTTRALDRENLLDKFTDYLQGKAPATADTSNPTPLQNADIKTRFKGLSCAKVCCGSNDTETRISELRFALGYNFLLEEDYHVGVNLQVVAPTGNTVDATNLFAAQNGNGNHWELGGALNAGFVLWRSEDEDKSFSFLLDANLTHMFKDCQKRCFDLCGKPLSRYMLAEKMTSPDNLPRDQKIQSDPESVQPTYQFNHEFAPVANVTTLNVDVTVGINADVVAMFNYTSKNWSVDLGYNFYGRSCEKIRTKCDCPGFEDNTWALKGDAHVYGFRSGTSIPLPLSATMSDATVTGGKNFGSAGVVPGSSIEALGKQNTKVDKPQLAAALSDGANLDIDSSNNFVQINSSFNPVLIQLSDINFAKTKGISHKIFSHVAYNWFDKEDWTPYIGVGFEVEFTGDSSNCNDCTSCDSGCDTSCNSTKTSGDCIKCGLDQWGIMVKGGVSF